MVSHSEISELLQSHGVASVVINLMDSSYILPTHRWIVCDLSAAVGEFLWGSKIKYQPEQFDCNKFAKTASTIADWCWAKTKQEDAALAFGIFCYFESASACCHAINIAIHRNEAGELELAFYEPQPQPVPGSGLATVCLKPKELTDDEIASCSACLFL